MKIHINSEDRADNETAEDFNINLSSINGRRTGVQTFMIGSVQLPLTFYQIRNNYNNSFTFTFDNGSSKTVYVGGTIGNTTEGSPSASIMATNIQGQININTSSQVFSVSVNTSTGRLTITKTSGANVFSITFNRDPYTYKVLGMTNNVQNSSVSGVIEGTNVVNMTMTDSIYIKSNVNYTNGDDWDSFNKSSNNYICKIPITQQGVSAFSNLYYTNEDLEERTIDRLTGHLNFQLVYHDGSRVNLNGHDYSMTLIYKY
jgi:hypothetical protein